MKIAKSWTRKGVTYTFASQRDAADWEWLRGLITQAEYVAEMGDEPQPYPGEERQARLAEIEGRAVQS